MNGRRRGGGGARRCSALSKAIVHSEDWLDRPLFDLFADAAARYPDKVALADGALSLRYSEVAERVAALGAEIAACTEAGAAVAVLLPHVAAQPVAVMACLAAGRVCLPLDAGAPAARNAAVLATSGARAVVMLEDDRTVLSGLDLAPIIVRADGMPVRVTVEKWSACPASVQAPALVLFTSGSSGTPKGIVLNQQAMTHQVLLDIGSCGLTPEDRYLAPLSPGTISPLRRLCAAWATGGTLHIVDVHRTGLGGVLACLRDQRITIGAIFPSLLRAMVTLPAARAAFQALRVLRVGGEALDWAEVNALRPVLVETCLILFTYGSTEMSPVLEHRVGPGPHPQAGPVPSGWEMPRCELTLAGPGGAPVARGAPGEAVLRSRYMASGHWENGQCVPGPFRPDPDALHWRVFHTGDLLRQRPDGAYDFIGRADRQVKIRGNRVEPAETEAFLRRQNGVADAAVIAHGVGDAMNLLAFVVPADGALLAQSDPVLPRALRAAMAANLPAHQRPGLLLLIERIPYMPSFKPDLAALRARAGAELRELNSGN